ncbi:hypothetical protein DOTSEDRAFT_72229 [Dothistroma septosporum NZE10]|uniref:Amine oxidase domain-containing protein n=1 Tax=Dothistroma septosporum (strain NZE10 / CBS 128990) TaxID=675120 RepID=N1PQJ7_DOTSN|nr:hypothetical protein DOTSEDRAFT_72229 [Dothistroma septosporum NZE10]
MLLPRSPYLASLALQVITTFASPTSSANATIETIDRDVVVIGGGSSGTYTAIRLQQLGKSVAVVEKQNRLGGHVNTYVDYFTNTTFDYGVIIMVNITVVRDYFAYLDIPMGTFQGYVPNQQTLYADFASETNVSTMYNDAQVAAAVLGYAAQLEKYSYLSSGYHLPDPIPKDLLLPFGTFLEKYNLTALAYTIWYINEGAGDILAQPTLYMLKYFGLLQAQGLAGVSGMQFVNANNDYQSLYNSALTHLGEDTNAFLDSVPTNVHRNDTGVSVRVATPTGEKLIRAKKLVVSIPPKIQELAPFLDMTSNEQALFSQFNNSFHYAVVVGNTGFPPDALIENLNPKAPADLPPMPAAYAFAPTPVEGLHIVWCGTSHYEPVAQIKTAILEAARAVQRTYNYTSPEAGGPKIIQFRDHSPTQLEVSVEAIKDRFYDKLNALQGDMNTFWTGATWESHSSSAIWNFTEYEVLPKILESVIHMDWLCFL